MGIAGRDDALCGAGVCGGVGVVDQGVALGAAEFYGNGDVGAAVVDDVVVDSDFGIAGGGVVGRVGEDVAVVQIGQVDVGDADVVNAAALERGGNTGLGRPVVGAGGGFEGRREGQDGGHQDGGSGAEDPDGGFPAGQLGTACGRGWARGCGHIGIYRSAACVFSIAMPLHPSFRLAPE